MSSQFRPWMVMVNSFVTALVFMLAFTSALLWCLVATTHRSVVHAEGRFYCFCFASRYIRTKLHPSNSCQRPAIQECPNQPRVIMGAYRARPCMEVEK